MSVLGLRWKNIFLGVGKGALKGGAVLSAMTPLAMLAVTRQNASVQVPPMPRGSLLASAKPASPGELEILLATFFSFLQYSIVLGVLLMVLGIPSLLLCIRTGRGGLVPVAVLTGIVSFLPAFAFLYLFFVQVSLAYLMMAALTIAGPVWALVSFWKTADPDDLHFESYDRRTDAKPSALMSRLTEDNSGDDTATGASTPASRNS